MRRSALERIRETRRKQMKPAEMDLDGLFRLMLGGEFNPTQRAFIYSNERIKAYKGPAGCAKTSTLACSGLMRALLMPGSKGFVGRYDYNDLMDTTALRMQEMINRLPKGVLLDRDKSPPMKWWLQPVSKEGAPSQITFMGMKEDLGSYEFNWGIVDEANEVEEDKIHQLNTRLRYKEDSGHDDQDYSLGLAFNPPDKHHWLFRACTGKDFQERKVGEPWMRLFEPFARENIRNLPDRYYEILGATLPEDKKQRLVDGDWGTDFGGQPVFREFISAHHVRDGLSFYPGSPLLRFWDFGYNRPYCCWAQLDWQGRLIALAELLGDKVEATTFAKQVLAKGNVLFPDAREWVDYGDPAVKQHKDTGQTAATLYQLGINIRFRESRIDPGLQLIRQRLALTIDGEPALQFSRTGVPILIGALRGGYKLKDDGSEPKKDGYYDHPVDAYRYGCINVLEGNGSYKVADLPASVAYDRAFDLGL